MFYVYMLKGRGNHIYVGYTCDLKKRMKEHQEGKTYTTARFRPLQLVYYEAYQSKKDALQREKSLKQYGNSLGHLKKRIQNSLNEK